MSVPFIWLTSRCYVVEMDFPSPVTIVDGFPHKDITAGEDSCTISSQLSSQLSCSRLSFA